MYSREEYAAKAAEMWNTLTPNERGFIAMGIFPATKMEAVEALGYETHPLVVALMNHHKNNRPEPQRRSER